MATAIRLARHGARKRPFYRIVVTDSRAPRDGRRIDQIGFYDPCQNPARVVIREDRLFHWLSRGAQPSPSVRQLIKRSGLAAVPPAPAVPVATSAADSGETDT